MQKKPLSITLINLLILALKKYRLHLLNFILLFFVINSSSFSQVYKIKGGKIGGVKAKKMSGSVFLSDSLISISIDINTLQQPFVNYKVTVLEDNEQMKTYKSTFSSPDFNNQTEVFFYFKKQKGILINENRNNATKSVFETEYELK